MPLRNIDWENDCREKCRCSKCCGVNEGAWYYCDDPCPDTSGSCGDWERNFNPETCDCELSFIPGGGNYKFTGTITDIPGDCIYNPQDGVYKTLGPAALWSGAHGDERCESGSVTCGFETEVYVSEPYYDSYYEEFLYGAPSWGNGASDIGGVQEGECCTNGFIPYAKKCERIRVSYNHLIYDDAERANDAGPIIGQAYTIYYKKVGQDAYSWVRRVPSFVGYASANGAVGPAILTVAPTNAEKCVGTGYKIEGTWSLA